MSRLALVFGLVALSSVSAGMAACVSSNSAPPAGSNDAGMFGEDATVPFDSAPGTHSGPTDANVPPSDAGTDSALSCGSWTPVVAFDASDWDGAPLSTTSSTGGPLPGPAPTQCIAGDVPAELFFLNDTPCSLDVWWVDWVCEEDFYGTIPPGDSWHIHSSSGSTWRLRAPGSEELLMEVVLPEPVDDAGVAPTTTIEYPPAAAGTFDAATFPPAPEGNPDAAACIGWDAATEYDASGWDGAPATLEDDAGTVPGPPATTCSITGDQPYEQMFVDNTTCPIDVYWVDYGCNEVFWQTIEMGRNGVATTFATNVWRLRAHGSGELLAQAPIVPEDAGVTGAVLRYP
jgi:hypothetical protein